MWTSETEENEENEEKIVHLHPKVLQEKASAKNANLTTAAAKNEN